MEHLQKQVLTLFPGEPPQRLDDLAEQGMRVCLIDGAYPPETRAALRSAVLDCFQRRNDPLGLMLRLTPDMDATSSPTLRSINTFCCPALTPRPRPR